MTEAPYTQKGRNWLFFAWFSLYNYFILFIGLTRMFHPESHSSFIFLLQISFWDQEGHALTSYESEVPTPQTKKVVVHLALSCSACVLLQKHDNEEVLNISPEDKLAQDSDRHFTCAIFLFFIPVIILALLSRLALPPSSSSSSNSDPGSLLKQAPYHPSPLRYVPFSLILSREEFGIFSPPRRLAAPNCAIITGGFKIKWRKNISPANVLAVFSIWLNGPWNCAHRHTFSICAFAKASSCVCFFVFVLFFVCLIVRQFRLFGKIEPSYTEHFRGGKQEVYTVFYVPLRRPHLLLFLFFCFFRLIVCHLRYFI